MNLPTLRTERLVLRPFRLDDAPLVQQYAGAREVALNTLVIPHPYPDGAAEQWIASHEELARAGTLAFAIDNGELVGATGLEIRADHGRAEIGYWIGRPWWGRGYASEAVRELLRYAFEDLQLNRVYALVFSRNPASVRVLQKNGMTLEGTLRQHVKKWGEYVDVEWYGQLSAVYFDAKRSGAEKSPVPVR